MKFTRTISAAAIVVGIAGAGVMMAAPANAAASDCPSGAACAWITSNFAGTELGFQQSIKDYTPYGYNDNISSVYNNGNASTVRFYKDANYKGQSFALAIKTGDGNLNNDDGLAPTGFNDKISSGRFV
ncbi:peptidase inhibitor family I36 protein [Curtobacterium sp. RHCJP20]|uniref:Peptidase inhibitor family I36 protein n=1 Tax=Curtobacterium subtropicum TaxID=3055138 RepID=A0ABT7TEV2_9MICO|nr:peptidase inhibitor family I36 protein [Curtobacterium subtropicum]MDM7888108.1 peptidase inhibitor family I36 protein [Curtobacterium subtropicum]